MQCRLSSQFSDHLLLLSLITVGNIKIKWEYLIDCFATNATMLFNKLLYDKNTHLRLTNSFLIYHQEPPECIICHKLQHFVVQYFAKLLVPSGEGECKEYILLKAFSAVRQCIWLWTVAAPATETSTTHCTHQCTCFVIL